MVDERLEVAPLASALHVGDGSAQERWVAWAGKLTTFNVFFPLLAVQNLAAIGGICKGASPAQPCRIGRPCGYRLAWNRIGVMPRVPSAPPLELRSARPSWRDCRRCRGAALWRAS